jgi:hypothetical protein
VTEEKEPTNAPEGFVKWDESWISPITDLVDAFYEKLGVNLSDSVALVPQVTPLNVEPEIITPHTKKQIRKMRKKELRKAVWMLEGHAKIAQSYIERLQTQIARGKDEG